MSRWMSRSVVPAVAVIAVAAAGCGSSSSSKSTAGSTPTPAATPSTPSTTSSTGSRIPRSTPIADPAFQAVLHASLIQNAHVPASKASAIEACVIQALPSKGIKTAGEFLDNRSESVAIIDSCAKQNGVTK